MVQMWNKSPIDRDTYIIGGTTTSTDFTETKRGECDNGCAFLATWTSTYEKFWGRWVINHVRSVVGIASESQGNYTSVIAYNGVTDDQH